MRVLLLLLWFKFAFACLAQDAPPRWMQLPATPAAMTGTPGAFAKVNGIRLYYVSLGDKDSKQVPVILLHGGLANSEYWAEQARALAPRHRVILIDSRGHGRSTRDTRLFGYDLMADDVIGLMNKLHVERADVVGWSDGGILSLDLAMRYPARVRRIFAFAANARPDGLIPDGPESPVFTAFQKRAGDEYRRLSSTPAEYDAFVAQITHMWESEPNWSDAQLKAIRARVLIVDGDHDEVIRREHTEVMANTIPGAGLLILPNASHFAFLQDPALFNAALLDFLDAA